jgi:hypothetical protein
MRTQSEIKNAMTILISKMSKREVSDPNLPFIEVINEHPDIKKEWDILMKEAEDLRSKGRWILNK